MDIAICCVCGFVHQDDRFGIRQFKLHYTWGEPISGRQGYFYHKTICAGCTGIESFSIMEWHQARTADDGPYSAELPGHRKQGALDAAHSVLVVCIEAQLLAAASAAAGATVVSESPNTQRSSAPPSLTDVESA